jgi:uncharacterized delta-60 repeat protein
VRQFGLTAANEVDAFANIGSDIYVAGSTSAALPGQTYLGGSADAVLRRYDANGNIVWTREFGSSAQDAADGIVTTATAIYVVGTVQGTLPGQASAGDYDAFVCKFDTAGNLVWTRQFGTSGYDQAYAVAVDSTGIYVGGETWAAFSGQTYLGDADGFVRKYDLSGNNVLWTSEFGASGHDSVFRFALDGSGLYVTGRVGGDNSSALPGQSSAGGYDAFVRKYTLTGTGQDGSGFNGTGVAQWSSQFGSSGTDAGSSLTVDATGVYVGGYAAGAVSSLGGTSAGGLDAFVRKYDSGGNSLWFRQYGSAGDDSGTYVTSDGAHVHTALTTTGTFQGQVSSGGRDVAVVEFDTAGNQLWRDQFGTAGDDYGAGIAVTSDGIYLAGQTTGTFPGEAKASAAGTGDSFLMKVTNPTPPITEFPLNANGKSPYIITRGPDGNLWFTDPGNHGVGKISPSGVISPEYLTSNLTPAAPKQGVPIGITAGPDGNIWYTDQANDLIVQMTTSGTVLSTYQLTSGSNAVSITTGPDGKLWFAEYNGNRIGTITTSGSLNENVAVLTANNRPIEIKTGPDGNLWFTEFQYTSNGTPFPGSKIGKITPAGVLTEYPVTTNSAPYGITAGPDGNIWFTEFSGNQIGQITPSGSVINYFPLPTSASAPTDITLGSDGNLWFVENDYGSNQFGRITTNGAITEFLAPTPKSQPYYLTSGPDGNLWFTEYDLQGDKIARISMPTATIAGTTPSLSTGTVALHSSSLQVAFNEPMVGTNAEGYYQLQSAGADGLLGTADDALVPVTPAAPTGAVSRWLAEGNANDAADGNNGTLVGGTTFGTGVGGGQAFSLNGVNNYVNVPNAANLSLSAGSFTLSAWINPTLSGDNNNHVILDKSLDNSTIDYLFMLNQATGRLNLYTRNLTNQILGPVIAANTWTHVVAVSDTSAGQLRLYVNGSLVATTSLVGSAVTNTASMLIGARHYQGTISDYFGGKIDDVGVYSRALSTSEVQGLYGSTSATLIFPAISPGGYRLTVKNTLTNTTGQALDGAGTGTAGSGNWVRDFVVPAALAAVPDTSFGSNGFVTTSYPTGVVSRYLAEGNANDSVDGNSGTLTGGATFTTGVNSGQAFSFNGTSAYVNVPNAANLNVSGNQLSVSAWVMKTGSTGLYRAVIDKGVGSASPFELRMARDQSTNPTDYGLFFGVTSTNGYVNAGYDNPATELTPNLWYHVAGTYDGSAVRLYINGNLVAQAAQTGNLITNITPVTIGADTNPPVSEYWKGNIDDVALFNRALSPAEVQALAQADVYNVAGRTARQSDGRIVAVGYTSNGNNDDIALARYLPDGQLDPTFGNNGRVTLDLGSFENGNGIAIQSDGKIVISGTTGTSNRSIVVARFNTDGTLDASFNGTGVFTRAAGGDDNAGPVSIQPTDGKILVSGFSFWPPNGAGYTAIVYRLNTDGTLDSSFGSSGLAVVKISNSSANPDYLSAMALQPDGKILLGANIGATSDIGLARLLSNGAPDSQFGSSGRLETNVSNAGLNSLMLLPNGTFMVMGNAAAGGVVSRWTANGTLDTSFGSAGKVTISAMASATQAVMEPSGQICVSGITPGSNPDFAVAALSPNGALDTTFNGSGIAVAGNPTASAYAYNMLEDPSGKLVVNGYTGNWPYVSFTLVRFDPAGNLLSPDGFAFNPAAGGFGAGELLQGTGNAFNGVNRLQVGGIDYAPSVQPVTFANGGRTLVTPSQALSGLTVSRKITVPNTGSQDFARTVDVFTNPTGSAISTTVNLIGNLGSDAATQVFATSTGGSTPGVNDQWFGTDGGPGTTAVLHIVHGPTGLKPTAVTVSGDNIDWTYNLTVPAGQTVELGTFTILATSRTGAIAEANALVTATGFGGQAAAFLSAADLAALANMQFTQPTTTTVASSANPAVFGQSVTFTATVSPQSGSGTPTGTVTFLDGSTTLGTATLASGQATFSTASLAVGSHSVTVSYSGDTSFTASTSSTLSETLNPGHTTTTVASATNPSVFGQSVTFTATVSAASPGSGTPTGTVTFLDGVTTLGTVTLSGGAASFSTASLAVASHTITASYNGSTSFHSSTNAAALAETVSTAAVTVSVSSSNNPALAGAPLTLTATVSVVAPSVADPVGIVTFYHDTPSDATVLGTSVVQNGVASISTDQIGLGSHDITAFFASVNGAVLNDNFLNTDSPPMTQSIVPVVATVVNGTLQVKADGQNHQLKLYQTPSTIEVDDASQVVASFPVSSVTSVVVHSGTGNTSVDLQANPSEALSLPATLYADTTTTGHATLTGGTGPDTLYNQGQLQLRPTLLVVIHGWERSRTANLDEWIDNAHKLATALEGAGSHTTTWVVDWNSTTGAVNSPSQKIADRINSYIAAQDQVTNVLLVGHSRGGIFARDLGNLLSNDPHFGAIQEILLDPTGAPLLHDQPTSR